MVKLEVIISKITVYLVYYITFVIPINKNKIAIISYFNETLGLEFEKLDKLLKNDGYLVKYCLLKFKGSLLGKFRYFLTLIYQTYLFNTSSVVILDGNSFVYSTIRVKKDVRTVQLWHATGAIKKFGMQVNRRYKIKGYDSLIVSSSFFKDIFAEALNTDVTNIHSLGTCKTDYLFDDKFIDNRKKLFYKKNPELQNKKIVLYAPTFRGDGIENASINCDIGKLNDYLSDEYHLIVTLHPLIKEYTLNDYKNKIEISNEDLYTLLAVSQCVISDYSALIFDAALLNKRVIMYLYDLESYKKNRGLCINVDDIPLQKSYTIRELYDIIISDGKNTDNREFVNKYLSTLDGQSTTRIFNHIKEIIGKRG